MTTHEALNKAKTLWGEGAFVSYDSRKFICYEVGFGLTVYGNSAESWQQAFDKAGNTPHAKNQ